MKRQARRNVCVCVCEHIYLKGVCADESGNLTVRGFHKDCVSWTSCSA